MAVNNPEKPPPRTTSDVGNGEDNKRIYYLPEGLPLCMVTSESLFSMKFAFGGPSLLNLPSTFAEFSQVLQSLDLHCIEFLDAVSLRNFISLSPCLENLNFKECVFCDFKILDISSTTLKKIQVFSLNTRIDNGLRNCEIKVACPNLVSFKFLLRNSASDFTFQETNCLRCADIYLIHPPDPKHATIEQYRKILSKLIKELCTVEVFRLTMPFCVFHFAYAEPEHFPISFNNLKKLFLYVGLNNWYMQSMINLLSCSPNLEYLEVNFYKHKCRFFPWIIPASAISCLTNHIKIIKIRGFENIPRELELVKFFIKYGKKLQEMGITWMRGVEKSEELMQYIKELPAASSSVVAVTFHECL